MAIAHVHSVTAKHNGNCDSSYVNMGCGGSKKKYSYFNAVGDKITYSGEKNKIAGCVVYSYANGDEIAGEYVNGHLRGVCTKSFANGDTFVGEYVDSVANGLGRKTFVGAGYYEGTYLDGVPVCGEIFDGMRVLANGVHLYGLADGHRVKEEIEPGRLRYFNGDILEADYHNGHAVDGSAAGNYREVVNCSAVGNGSAVIGVVNGPTVKKYVGGDSLYCTYSEGRPHGEYILKSSDGKKTSGTYCYGKEEGLSVTIYPDECKKAKMYRHGVCQYETHIEMPTTKSLTASPTAKLLVPVLDEKAPEGTDDRFVCVICAVHISKVTLRCGHCCLCVACSRNSAVKRCPLCRSELHVASVHY
jgi:hypothetical protein